MVNKKNIIIIITDDQGYWSLGSYGNNDAITPNLDYLANNGVKFNNFFCVSPVCSPARASIYTGRIPSQHGIHDWLIECENGCTTEKYLSKQSTFVDLLANNGYECAMSGKWHLGESNSPQNGFKYWYAHASGGGPYYGAPMYKDGVLVNEKGYITDLITDYGVDFLNNQRNNENPFFLSLNYTAPHDPWDCNNHPKELLDLYKDCEFNSCPREEKHPWKIHCTFWGNEEERRAQLRGYFASLTSVDNNIGRVIKKLKEINELENTLIIFTSDNGMNMGHHGIYGKGNGTSPVNMYDTSVKVPFFITKIGEFEQKTVDGLYSHYDIRPTLLEYLNIKDGFNDNIKLPGKSFANLLLGKEEDENSNIVVYDEYGPVRMIRTKEWKYIHRYPSGPHELFDLINDPNEKVNLINDISKKSIVNTLRIELKKWFIKYINPEIDGAQLPVYGGGQRGLAGLWGNEDDEVFDRYESDFIFTNDNKLIND